MLALDATVALGSRPAPDVIQPAWPHQAASSRATLAGGAARAAKLGIFTVAPPAQSTDICDQARGRPSLRRNSRPSRGSAALAFPTSGFSTERVRGQHAWSQMHGRLRRQCAGAVLKKIAARFSLRGLRARIDTIAHATEAHGVRRATVAAARRTGARVQSCGATAQLQRVGEPSFEG